MLSHWKNSTCCLAEQKSGCRCLIVGCGQTAVPAQEQLRRLGIVEGETVLVVRSGRCMMLDCGGSRIALHRTLAKSVLVEVLEAEAW